LYEKREMLVNFDVPLQAFRTTPDDQFRQNWVIKTKPENTKPSSLTRDIKCVLNFALTIFIKGRGCSLWSRKEIHVSTCCLLSTCRCYRATKDAKLPGKKRQRKRKRCRVPFWECYMRSSLCFCCENLPWTCGYCEFIG